MVINLFDFRKKNLTEIDDIKQESVSKIFKQNYVFLVSSVTIAQDKQIKLITPRQYMKNGNIVNKKIIIQAIHPLIILPLIKCFS